MFRLDDARELTSGPVCRAGRATLLVLACTFVRCASDPPGPLADAAGTHGQDAGAIEDAADVRDADDPQSDSGELDGGEGDAGDRDATAIDEDAGAIEVGLRSRVAFTRGSARETDLYWIDLDGRNEQRLTTSPGVETAPSWSPDGTKIAFASNKDGRYGIYALDVATRTSTVVTLELPVALGPAFSPDGSKIAFQGRADAISGFDVFVVDSRGGPAQRLTNDPGSDAGPAWSPDGSTIYFVSNRTGIFEVYAMNADGSSQRPITSGSLIVGKPSVSADGAAIYFGSGDDELTVIQRMELTTMGLTPLTDDQDAEPAPSPDGRYLAFSSWRYGDPEILLLDLISAGAPLRLTMTPEVDGAPAISPPVF